MNRLKKILGKLFFVLLVSMAAASITCAATTTDVEIRIEAPEGANEIENRQIVQTGDNKTILLYALCFTGAIALIIACIKKGKGGFKRVLIFMIGTILLVLSLGFVGKAADMSDQVNVTIPTNIAMKFNDDGSTSISEFEIENALQVPITIEKVKVTEYNNWELVEKEAEISVDSKKFVFLFESNCLKSGENHLAITIPEMSKKSLQLDAMHGPWTQRIPMEKAICIEIEYSFGSKAFSLKFETDGGSSQVATMTAINGEIVPLPKAEKKCHVLKGWQDEKGNLYTSEFIMPIGDVTLTAKWQKTEAYAVYSQDDKSLTFYRSETPIPVGEIHNGKIATAVYTGMETDTYLYATVPWRPHEKELERVVFQDIVVPDCMEYWFRGFSYVKYVDVTNLDLTQAKSIRFAFMDMGKYAEEVYFEGLEDLDVSNIEDMWQGFDGCGQNAKKIHLGDLSKWDVSNVKFMLRLFCFLGKMATEIHLSGVEGWDVSNVVNMSMMFYDMAYNNDTWSVDLSGWDVRNVEYHTDFSKNTGDQVKEPCWVQ